MPGYLLEFCHDPERCKYGIKSSPDHVLFLAVGAAIVSITST